MPLEKRKYSRTLYHIWFLQRSIPTLKKRKSYNMVNGYVQNRQQPRLEVLNEIAIILDVDVRELIVSNKEDNK